jgi:hypothetical protein
MARDIFRFSNPNQALILDLSLRRIGNKHRKTSIQIIARTQPGTE